MTFSSHSPQRRSIVYVGLVVIVSALIYWTGRPPAKPVATQQLLQGSTMGTTYTIRYIHQKNSPSLKEIYRLVEDELMQINLQMSTYMKESEISRFNDSSSSDWFPVSIQTAQVVELAREISQASDGAFDVTVGPLVNLWGFGPEKNHNDLPSDAAVDAAKATVGFKKLDVRLAPPALKKAIPAVRVDLSAIAQGHGSDRVAEVLRARGLTNYFVEIGGEIVASGTRADGKPWQVGIEAPLDYERTVHAIVGLSGSAITTSGDYRNFFERDGQRFSHTIDPSTGRPVSHQLASATVVADNCALADAVATCMMVLGPEKGRELAEQKNWAVMLIQRHEGKLLTSCSTRFAAQFPEVFQQLSAGSQNIK